MLKHVMVPTLIALVAAACTTTSDRNNASPTPAWRTIYTVPYEAMVGCLSMPAGDGFVVNREPVSPAGVATITFVPRSAPQAESRYTVQRVPDGTIQVNWQRLGNIGGLDWLDTQARDRANRCGGIS